MTEIQSNYPREVQESSFTRDLIGLNRTARVGLVVAIIFGSVVGIMAIVPMIFGSWDLTSTLYLMVETTFGFSGLALIVYIYRWVVQAQNLIGKIRREPPTFPVAFLGLICSWSFLSGFIFLILTMTSFIKRSELPNQPNDWAFKLILFSLSAVGAYVSGLLPLIVRISLTSVSFWGHFSSFALIFALTFGCQLVFLINKNIGLLASSASNSSGPTMP